MREPNLPAPRWRELMARPSDYSPAIGIVICARMVEGESLRSICRDPDMPSTSAVFRWLAANAPFRDQYARAMDTRADAMAEQILEISDDDSDDVLIDPESGNMRMNSEFVARSRLRVDTRKWLMARMAPKKYGDKITTELMGKVELSPVINVNASGLASGKSG